jgi:hypothetical protein
MTESTNGEQLTSDELTAALKGYITALAGSYQGQRAGVELLLWHESWIRRADFRRACVRYYPDEQLAEIRWEQVEAFADSTRASTSERAVLEFAASLGLDRYQLSGLGHAHRRAFLAALETAVTR